MKTLADLKKDLAVGVKVKRLFGPKNNGEILTVTQIQSNGLQFGKSWLDYPVSSLLDYDDKIISIFEPANRPLTAEEQQIIDNRPIDKKQSDIDMLSDGSMMFRREQRYFSEQKAEWYWGKWSQGKRYSRRDNTMFDKKVRGKLSLQYKIV